MADFKIKSTAGTGNKTLIQSRDQSGSSYAIQVGDAGATTLTNATITMSAGTIGSGVAFPKGVSQDYNYLLRTLTSGTSNGGALGGTGTQQLTWTDIKNGTEDSAFTQNILGLSANFWTMNTGYYLWDFIRPTYNSNHAWVLGVCTYGASDGSGSGWGNITTDNVNFGSYFYYTNSGAAHGMPMLGTGLTKVTSTSQKYGFLINVEANNAHSTSTYTHSSTHKLIQYSLRFIKIGDI